MAKITGEPGHIGTIGFISIYETQKWGYLMRKKSSLTGERVKKDPAFRQTMHYAGLMSQASKIGSAIYHQLATPREFPLFRKITGEAIQLIKEGKTKEEVISILETQWLNKE